MAVRRVSLIAISAADERDLALRAKLLAWKKGGAAVPDELTRPRSGWRVSRLFSRIAFFVLALLAAASFWGLCELLSFHGELVTGVSALVLAEVLIRRRFLRTGIEEAFYIAGLCALIFAIPSEGSVEGLLLFAAAFAVAGARLAEPLFVAAAPYFVIAYLSDKTHHETVGGLASLVIFGVAVVLARAEQQRPFVAHALDLLKATALPVGFLLLYVVFDSPSLIPYSFLALGLGVGGAAMFQALRDHDRALLIGGGLTLTLAAALLGGRLDVLPHEWEMILAGSVVMIVTMHLHRRLAGRRIGITSDAITSVEGIDSLEVAATLAAAAAEGQGRDGAAAPVVSRAESSSTGSFGGAGASGDY